MKEAIELAREGNKRAQEIVQDALRERVQRTAGHYANLTGLDADDLQQEMWLGICCGLQVVDTTIGEPLCYLYLRGKWRLLEAIRRSNRERADSLDLNLETLCHYALEEEVAATDLAWRFRSQLDEQQRAIFDGLLAGHMQKELAKALGCSAANVSYHVQRIRARFMAIKAEEGSDVK